MTAIRRVWRGRTSWDHAAAYESLLLREILPGIAARQIPGYRSATVSRRDGPDGAEFMTILEFDSMEGVRSLVGEDLEAAYVPDAARTLLIDFDRRAVHYTALMCGDATDATSTTPSPASLAAEVRAVVERSMWHGPSIMDALDGVSASVAAAHPIEGAHSIWELTLHVGQWAEVVTERLAGQDPWVSPERNFPPVEDTTEASWSAAIHRTEQLVLALADQVESLDPRTLWEDRPDGSSSFAAQVRGHIEHGVYHAGQIVLLRQAAGAWPPG